MGRGSSGLSGKGGGGGAAVQQPFSLISDKDKILQKTYASDIGKLSDKQIDKMPKKTLETWLAKAMMAHAGESFQPKTLAEAKSRATALLPFQSIAQLRKSLKYERKVFRRKTK